VVVGRLFIFLSFIRIFIRHFVKKLRGVKRWFFCLEWFSTNWFCEIDTGEPLPDVMAWAKGHIMR